MYLTTVLFSLSKRVFLINLNFVIYNGILWCRLFKPLRSVCHHNLFFYKTSTFANNESQNWTDRTITCRSLVELQTELDFTQSYSYNCLLLQENWSKFKLAREHESHKGAHENSRLTQVMSSSTLIRFPISFFNTSLFLRDLPQVRISSMLVTQIYHLHSERRQIHQYFFPYNILSRCYHSKESY